MTRNRVFVMLCVFAALSLPLSEVPAAPKACPAKGRLKVFILSGQSNMVGFGQLEGSPGTMET